MLNYNSLRKLAGIIAGSAGLNVDIDSRHEIPHTGGSRICMPPIPHDERSDEHTWWWYAFIHECEHNRGNNANDLRYIVENKIDMRSPFGHVLNIIADHNIENKAYAEYTGKDKYLNKGRDLHYGKMNAIEEGEELNNKMAAVWVFDAYSRSLWSGIVHRYDDMPAGIQKYIDALMPLIDEYKAKRDGGEDNIAMCRKVWDILDITDEENKDESQEGEGGGDSREQQAKDMAADAEQKYKELREMIEEMAKEMLPHDHGAEEGEEYELPTGSDDIELKWDGAYVPVEHDTIHLYEGEEHCDTSKLASQVSKLLRVYSQVKYQGGKPRGKVNRRTLHRVPDGYQRVFRQKREVDVLDTTVSLLVDASGSMSGDKYAAAREATAQMGACLNKIGIPYEVVAFTQQEHDKQQFFVVKDYTNNAAPSEIKGRMKKIRLTQNLDGDALNWTHSRIAKRKQKRKVLIVLSDGQPSGWCTGSEAQHLKDVVKAIEKQRAVELYAVGVLTDAPRYFYSNYQLLDDPNDIEQTVINLIKNSIIK